MDSYQKKIDFAIKLLKSIPQDGEIEVAVSGGKDSDVILQLVKEAGIPYRAIHKCTTIDPPGTLAHVKELGCEIIRPKMTFFDIIKKKGCPSRFQRTCCSILKEYPILDRCVIGVRRAESNARAERYKEPEICRAYTKTKKVKQYFPILEWTNEDVERFIKERELKCAPVYYDEDGKFHVERRLGCLCCPLINLKSRRNQFAQYPKMLKLYIKNFQFWLDNHIGSKMYNHCQGSPYNKMFLELFCDYNLKLANDLIGGVFSPN